MLPFTLPEILDLGTNNLHGRIPNQLGRLNHLKELYLDSNAITGTIPVGLGNLVSLEIMSLRFNRLSGTIPVSIGRCRQLKRLFLNNNLLDGPILPGLLKSKKLEFLTLGPNLLTGTIPSQIVNLKALQERESSQLSIFKNQTLSCFTHINTFLPSVISCPSRKLFDWYYSISIMDPIKIILYRS